MTKYEKTWKECQPEEKKRIRNQRLSKLDDEIPRGGNSISTVLTILFVALIIGIGAHVFVNHHKALPVASATIKA